MLGSGPEATTTHGPRRNEVWEPRLLEPYQHSAVYVLLVYRFDGGCATDISDIKMISMEIEGLKMDYYVQ